MFLSELKKLDAVNAEASNSQKAKINTISILLGGIGFGVSLYALVLHVKNKTSSAALSCDINDLVNCTKVIGGEYGEFLGIPLGAYGMSYFGMVIAAGALPAFVSASASWMARWQMLIAAVGAFVSIILAYISYFKIQAVCLVCSGIHVLSLVNFIFTFISFFKVRQQPQAVGEGGGFKLLAGCLALGVPPLLAGALFPLISSTLGGESQTSSQAQSPAVASTPFPSEWLQVSVSNYVGKGEDFRKGSDQAKVVVHMFSDLECPHCKVTAEDIETAQSAVGADQVLFVYRNYPLSNKCNINVGGEGHPYACDLAMALRCAGSQKKDAFWEYKTWAFSGIDMSPEERQQKFSQQGLVAQAEKLKLDPSRFEACLKDRVELPKIQDDIQIGKKMGLTGTPLIVINGRVYTGERGPQGYARAFRDALESK